MSGEPVLFAYVEPALADPVRAWPAFAPSSDQFIVCRSISRFDKGDHTLDSMLSTTLDCKHYMRTGGAILATGHTVRHGVSPDTKAYSRMVTVIVVLPPEVVSVYESVYSETT